MGRLYVDLDGVLANFDLHFKSKIGTTFAAFESSFGSKLAWGTIRSEFDRFFLNLPKMPDADILMKRIEKSGIRPIILTGCPRGDWSQIEKIRWGEKHFPGIPVVTCLSANKKDYCYPSDILIDDTLKYRSKWEAAGGSFIHHTCAENSIMQLEEMGII